MLTIIPPTTSVYAGSFITVNCTVQLSSAVDSPVTVTAIWRKNGVLLTGSAVLDTILVSNLSMYLAQVVFRPVQLSTDNGVYACEVSINAELDKFIVGARQSSDNISLHASGVLSITLFRTHIIIVFYNVQSLLWQQQYNRRWLLHLTLYPTTLSL